VQGRRKTVGAPSSQSTGAEPVSHPEGPDMFVVIVLVLGVVATVAVLARELHRDGYGRPTPETLGRTGGDRVTALAAVARR
jgi:hypothetical protein